MIILALDTSGAACSAALVRGGDTLAVRQEPMRKGHAERLAPMVNDVIAEVGITPDKIDRIAVITGPGAFTGVRIGLSFARGLGLALGVPVIGLTALEYWARKADPDAADELFSVHDARRGEVMLAKWQFGDMQPAERVSVEEAKALTAGAHLVGSGAALLGGQAQDFTIYAETLARMANNLAPEAYPPTAFYHRPPDAKLPGGKSLDAL